MRQEMEISSTKCLHKHIINERVDVEIVLNKILVVFCHSRWVSHNKVTHLIEEFCITLIESREVS